MIIKGFCEKTINFFMMYAQLGMCGHNTRSQIILSLQPRSFHYLLSCWNPFDRFFVISFLDFKIFSSFLRIESQYSENCCSKQRSNFYACDTDNVWQDSETIGEFLPVLNSNAEYLALIQSFTIKWERRRPLITEQSLKIFT